MRSHRTTKKGPPGAATPGGPFAYFDRAPAFEYVASRPARAAGSGQKHRTAHGPHALSLLRSHPDEVRRSSVAPGPSINAACARQSVSERSEGRDSASHNAGLEKRAPQTPRLARSNRDAWYRNNCTPYPLRCLADGLVEDFLAFPQNIIPCQREGLVQVV